RYLGRAVRSRPPVHRGTRYSGSLRGYRHAHDDRDRVAAAAEPDRAPTMGSASTGASRLCRDLRQSVDWRTRLERGRTSELSVDADVYDCGAEGRANRLAAMMRRVRGAMVLALALLEIGRA